MRRTWRALLEPKRLVPVLLVSAALVTAQASFGGDRLAVPLGVAMCLAFVLVAPVSWRVLFPFGPQLGQLLGPAVPLRGGGDAGWCWSSGRWSRACCRCSRP